MSNKYISSPEGHIISYVNLSFKCFVFNSEHNRGEKSRKWPLQGLVKGKA